MKKIWKDNAKLILSIAITIVIASSATFAATTMYDSNIVSYDNTSSGLRSTNVQSALDELYGNVAEVILNMKSKLEELYNEKNDIASGESTAGYHNSTFRGKDVSSYMPSSVVSGGDGSIYDRIAGTNGYRMFEDLYVGDYIVADNVNDTVNGIVWRIAGFDIYYGKGDTAFTSHHAVIVPDTDLTSSYMNSSNTTSGGYAGSYMCTTTLPNVLTTYVNPVFSGHVISYRTVLSNRVNTSALNNSGGRFLGATDNWSWYSRQLDLMNEVQLTGNSAVSSSYFDVGTDNIQFPLFRLRPEFVNKQRSWYWTRSVADYMHFIIVTEGNMDGFVSDASHTHGVRPYFYIG